VVIDMPRAEEIIRTMQECFAEAQYKATSTLQVSSDPSDPTEADGWLTNHETSGSVHPEKSHLNLPQVQQTSSEEHAEGVSAQDQNHQHAHDSFIPGTLGQGDLGLDQIFDPPHDQTRDRHDVDDITAVLSNAHDTEFALSQIDDAFLTATLDPTLHDPQQSTAVESTVESQKGPETLDQHATTRPEGADGSATVPATSTVSHVPAFPTDVTPPKLHLVAPQSENLKIEMVPLPLVLVRQSDGVGFGVGRNVVAERVDSKTAGNGDKPRWGEFLA
jgi:hypothetical protein